MSQEQINDLLCSVISMRPWWFTTRVGLSARPVETRGFCPELLRVLRREDSGPDPEEAAPETVDNRCAYSGLYAHIRQDTQRWICLS